MLQRLLAMLPPTVAAKVSPIIPAVLKAPVPVVLQDGPTIVVVNESTVLTDAEVKTAVAAIQVQVSSHFAPLWGMPATLIFMPKGTTPPATSWQIFMLDTSDEAGALGYHTMTSANMPIGRIFAKDDAKYNLSWTVTLSHEVLEMLGDPYIDTSVFLQETDTTGNLIAFEMCDPVESDSMGYKVNGVLLSNFVTPAFFESGRPPGSTKFDFMGVLKEPLSIGAEGYLSVFPVNPTTKGWSQQTGAEGVGPRLQSKGDQSRAKRRAKKAAAPVA